MSFATDVKKELVSSLPNARHCRIAELAAIVSLNGTDEARWDEEGNGVACLVIRAENTDVAARFSELCRKLLGFEPEMDEDGRAAVVYDGQKDKILEITKCRLAALINGADEEYVTYLADEVVYRQTCCKRAFLRCAFLVSGSISNPEKMYHFEIAVGNEIEADRILKIMSSFDIEGHLIRRKKHFVVYVKEGEQIVDLLNVMEAHVALMNLENIRIMKELRNDVNRRVNCDSANINRVVAAANKQKEAIKLIQEKIGLNELPEELEETARLRIEYPEASLIELGALHGKPIGKSGVNHRLNKLISIANDL